VTPLEATIEAELGAPVPAPVRAAAEAARLRHGGGVCAVLFYGSCLREGCDEDRIVDLYLLADGYASVHARPVQRWLNRLLPPNVYYLEAPHGTGTVRAKYALVGLAHLERLVRPEVRNPYFWARLAQPVALAWARDPDVRARIRNIVTRAVATTFEAARPLAGEEPDASEVWERALAESYRTELRAEPPGRARELVAHDAERYRRIAAALRPMPGGPAASTTAAAARRWHRRRLEGKALSILRLAKASFTFEAGPDYVAWKIRRHTGVPVTLTSWQRRHPLLAAPLLLWRLARRGAVR
jgi:hypothetical protein